MTPSETSSLTFWEWFATLGFLLVIAGCIIEGVEHFIHFKKGESKKRKGLEKLGWFILVGGLAMEFLGDKMAKRISERENARLKKEAGEARKEASLATERAALADERSKTNEIERLKLQTQVEESIQTNLILRSNLMAIELKMRPRTISERQRTLFTESIQNFPKAHIDIWVVAGDDEALQFAQQLQKLLVASGYDASPNFSSGIISGPNAAFGGLILNVSARTRETISPLALGIAKGINEMGIPGTIQLGSSLVTGDGVTIQVTAKSHK